MKRKFLPIWFAFPCCIVFVAARCHFLVLVLEYLGSYGDLALMVIQLLNQGVLYLPCYLLVRRVHFQPLKQIPPINHFLMLFFLYILILADSLNLLTLVSGYLLANLFQISFHAGQDVLFLLLVGF